VLLGSPQMQDALQAVPIAGKSEHTAASMAAQDVRPHAQVVTLPCLGEARLSSCCRCCATRVL